MRKFTRMVVACLAIANLAVYSVRADDSAPSPFEKTPQLKSAAAEDVRATLFAWLDSLPIDPHARTRAIELWSSAGEPTGVELLELVAATAAFADDRAAQLVAFCIRPRAVAPPPDQAWLNDPQTPDFVKNNLRLYYGRWLAQHAMYDESLTQLDELEPGQVVDPATLLFFQAVDFHHLLKREEGLRVLGRLENDVADSPDRYTALASLMYADLKGLEDESLDHIARRMADIRRRLDLGRAGAKTREVEDGVIASLDKMIDELEKQQQQQQQQQSSSGGSSQPQMPANDSRIMGGSGRGESNKRDLGDAGSWGGLPPKTREEALQQIGKDFPAHYRDVVEQYFRKLATQRSDAPQD